MAIVRPHAPNFAELALYAPLSDDYDMTYFYAGAPEAVARHELDALGCREIAVRRYKAMGELVPTAPLRRAFDYKLGFASGLLDRLDEILAHDIVNLVDPTYFHARQIVDRLRPDQRLVVVRFEMIPERYHSALLAGEAAARVLARADAVLCATEAARRSLLLPESAAPRVETLYPAVAVSNPEATPAAPSVEGAPVVTMVARLQWQKGVQDFIAALAVLRRAHGLNVVGQLIGGGRPEPWRRLAGRLGVADGLRLEGRLDNAAVRAALRASHAYCQPSLASRTWCEQLGYAVLEAMGEGVPVVAYRSGALEEVIGPDGRFAAARNVGELADRLAEAVALPEAERAAEGQRLAARVRSCFDPARQAETLRGILASLR